MNKYIRYKIKIKKKKYPSLVTLQAPVIDPGLITKRFSTSYAWNSEKIPD